MYAGYFLLHEGLLSVHHQLHERPWRKKLQLFCMIIQVCIEILSMDTTHTKTIRCCVKAHILETRIKLWDSLSLYHFQ